jgi:hypothetical protein
MRRLSVLVNFRLPRFYNQKIARIDKGGNVKRPLLIGALAAATFATPALADPVQIQGTATATVHNTDPGLVLWSTPGAFNISLDLDGSPSSSMFVANLFTVGTDEGTVNVLPAEDNIAYPVSVLFSFTNPWDASGNPLTGQSFGFIALNPFSSCGIFTGGCGAIQWSGPQTFNFGNGGSFSVALNDVTFGTPGSAQVGGTFTLISNSVAPVPEPATWAMMLVGFGAVGYAMRRRRRGLITQLA